MTRLHADPVEVHTRAEPAGPVPDQFLWRGRLHLVVEVHARWTEAGSWWRGAALTALRSGDAGPSSTGPAGAGTAGPTPTGIDDGERTWWRVEAGSGRASASSSGTGVYDLCFDPARGTWSLARVLD